MFNNYCVLFISFGIKFVFTIAATVEPQKEKTYAGENENAIMKI